MRQCEVAKRTDLPQRLGRESHPNPVDCADGIGKKRKTIGKNVVPHGYSMF
ncbi:hypothetical protein Isop_1878 [Isosphaera pallida ATCC 43644]|uniref:Uncharacterized protein n=1 Tax=Isosphaera pallida (strain ATCC 43644 / DSM 9630 / IS1B) TaxID=575540 RepID=E8R227_ISOPI|nr:hypothetical protein Isop_1878 [Isosphaera pallida ATCC 43644]